MPLLGLFASNGLALGLRALPEFLRPDPFGGIVQIDTGASSSWQDTVKVTTARNGYRSFQLVATADGKGEYRLSVDLPLTADLYREWFHFNTPDGKYYPDALIPIRRPYQVQIPDPANRITGQTAQALWVDLWIPASAEPRVYRGQVRLSSVSEEKTVQIEVTVLAATNPEKDAVTIDHNSYGASWLFEQYPKALAQDSQDELFRLIHAHHRIFYDHRGTFHQLGYGHAGKVDPEFAPEISGSGRQKHVTSWDLFDRHYGPLLDGSAFRDSRRGPRPIPFVYLAVNPEWPASFLWWGEPGYEAEFTNVLREMERHFREKNWTSTGFEVFFNHKKRYKGFHWDGDEIRFGRDNENLITYHRMLQKALPADSPVHFPMRVDTSWSFEEQSKMLQGVVRLWVVGEGESSWYPEALKRLKENGDTVWTYGGTPTLQQVSSWITLNPLRSWITGVDGFVRWQTGAPGLDPWFRLGGGGETLIYPGERFGIAGPLASIRLKIQRNCLQDLALLEEAAKNGSREGIQRQVVQRFNNTKLEDWRNTRPALASKPVIEWNNPDIGDALKPFEGHFLKLQSNAWERVRELALQQGANRP